MPCRHLCVPLRLQYMVPHWRPATTGWFHGIDVLDDAVAWAALVPPDCYPAYAFAKRALQATTMAAIDVAERLDRDWLSRCMSDPGSLRAHARRYRELKGREITWALPS
jgi:enoyl-CoA hydratase